MFPLSVGEYFSSFHGLPADQEILPRRGSARVPSGGNNGGKWRQGSADTPHCFTAGSGSVERGISEIQCLVTTALARPSFNIPEIYLLERTDRKDLESQVLSLLDGEHSLQLSCVMCRRLDSSSNCSSVIVNPPTGVEAGAKHDVYGESIIVSFDARREVEPVIWNSAQIATG
ncbi:unnamed protein product [Notodromas monacha]|uniref:Uncharacterized protein n=1 Tax=Notodromas monacha TaxID=399045 RepID=A0A7R9BCN1_9CRUS|nr:unnamed protein product [Notodromas monacha]CAG0912836.1 unnamed protein product [Notodromas monacha]